MKRSGAPRILIFLLLAAPALWLGYLVFTYGVDTPYGDQWDVTWPILIKLQTGTLRFSDFCAFHNEHRILFPSLLTFALMKLTHWNVRAELLVIWILACICALNVWRLAMLTGFANSRRRIWLLFAANVLLFTPLQWENFLWGFQIGFLLPLACMTALPWAASSRRRPQNYLVTLALCLVSTFSIASGFASWLLAAPLLWLGRDQSNPARERKWQMLWIGTALLSVVLYFRGYEKPAVHPSPLAALRNPLAALEFFLAYLGQPFAYGTRFDVANLAVALGVILLIPFSACLFYLGRVRKDEALLLHALPWVSLIGIALTNAFLTTIGRMGFGIAAALQSRYISFAVMLPIGLIFLAPIVWNDWRKRAPSPAAKLAWSAIPFCVALAVLLFCGTIESLGVLPLQQHHRFSGKASVILNRFIDPAVSADEVHWAWWDLRDRASGLDSLGYLKPRPLRSADIRQIASDSAGEKMGKFERFGKNPVGDMAAAGWAILPQSGRVADCVVLTYENDTGVPTIFARAEVKVSRDDLLKNGLSDAYRNCGWRIKWKASAIPAGTKRIGFWAFDAEEGRAFAIGSASL